MGKGDTPVPLLEDTGTFCLYGSYGNTVRQKKKKNNEQLVHHSTACHPQSTLLHCCRIWSEVRPGCGWRPGGLGDQAQVALRVPEIHTQLHVFWN